LIFTNCQAALFSIRLILLNSFSITLNTLALYHAPYADLMLSPAGQHRWVGSTSL